MRGEMDRRGAASSTTEGFDMWLPHWLYESLPLLYALTAAACLFALESSFGSVLSTTALAAAAVSVWNMRRKARSAVLRKAHRRSSRQQPR
jgi:hypothetical protein